VAVSARLAALACAALVLVLGTAGPVHAHGGPATFDVLSDLVVAAGRLELRVAVAHEADDHPAEGAIVDAVAVGPDGAASPAIPLAHTADVGVYAGTVALPVPGAWTLTVTSAFPPGTLDLTVDVAAAPDTPSPPTTAVVGAAATPTTAGPPVVDLDEPEVGGAEGGTDRTNLVIAVVSGVVGGCLGLWASRRRAARRTTVVGDVDTD